MRKSVVLLAMSTWLSLEGTGGCQAVAATAHEASPPAKAGVATRTGTGTGTLSPDAAPPVFNVAESSCSASRDASLPIALAVLAVVLRRRRDPELIQPR